MLRSLHIEGFRGVDSLSVDNFQRVNIFTGKNGSGKTTVLEALFLNLGANNASLSKTISDFRDDFETSPFNYRFVNGLCYKMNVNRNPTIRVTGGVTDSRAKRELRIVPLTSGTEGSVPTATASTGGERRLDGVEFQFKGPSGKFESKLSWESFPGLRIGPGSEQQAYTLQRAGELSTDLIKAHFLSPYMKGLWRQIYNQLTNLVKRRRVSKLVDSLKFLQPNLKDLIPLSEDDVRVIYADVGDDILIPVSLLGAGFISALRIFITAEQIESGVIIIDEIEDSLHYSAIDKVIRSLFEISEKNNIQFFVSSHSDEVLRRFVHLSNKLNYRSLALYRLGVRDNAIYGTRFNRDELQEAVEISAEVR